MAHLLFVMHGMGRHVPNWSDDTVTLLQALPGKYGYVWFTDNGAVKNHVTVVPVNYDGVFDGYLQRWGSSTEELRIKAAESGVDISGVLGWLESADETEKNFFWTHVVDVILYRFFEIVTADVRLRVRRQIVAALEKEGEGGQIIRASVLAHSLGTSVSHDSLALLGSQPVDTDDGPNEAWLAGNHHFANIFMCANVGRVLETQPEVYKSVVRPPGVGVTSYVDAYYNFRHRFDPFAMVRPFAPVGWDPSRFITVENCEKVLKFNVHGLDHYLDDPRVHVPILRALAGDWCITAAQEHAAIAAYDAKEEPPCIGELLAFKAKAQKIIALAQTGADPIALAIAGSQFLAAAQKANNAC